MNNRSSMSFTEKRISINALIAFVLGIVLNVSHGGMAAFSVIQKGNVPFAGGVVESYIFLLSIFGLFWALSSLDDEKTNGKYKIPAIIMNGISLALSIMIMALGVMNY